MIHENNLTANLLIWETNPALRNKNNIIELYADELNEGDIIVGSNFSPEQVSTYTIDKILERRYSKIKGKEHFICKTSWNNNSISDFKGYDISRTSKTFQKLING